MFLLMTILFYGIGAWLPDVLVEDGWSESIGGGDPRRAQRHHGRRHDPRRHRSAPARGRAGSCMVPATCVPRARHAGASRRIPTAVAVGVRCSAAGIGTMFPTMMTLPVDVADRPESVGAVAGLMLLVGYVGAAPTPSLLGALRDWTGAYDRDDLGAWSVVAGRACSLRAWRRSSAWHRGVP
jgi:cyanate permease